MKEIIEDIETTIQKIKEKGDQHGFDYTDTKVILCLEIARLEISNLGKISVLTAKALTEITSMDARQSYRNIYPVIFDFIKRISRKMKKIEPSYYNDIGIIGFKPEVWQGYFNSAIVGLIENIRKKEGWSNKNS